jgi:hypothetical protein
MKKYDEILSRLDAIEFRITCDAYAERGLRSYEVTFDDQVVSIRAHEIECNMLDATAIRYKDYGKCVIAEFKNYSKITCLDNQEPKNVHHWRSY